MGAYINPETESKEVFLAKEGKSLNRLPCSDDITTESLPVCLVRNPCFSAAAILYSPGEIAAFTNASDPRPRQFYIVPISKLHAVSDELKLYTK